MSNPNPRPFSEGRFWTVTEIEALIAGFRANTPVAEIAATMGRSENSVAMKAHYVGLYPPRLTGQLGDILRDVAERYDVGVDEIVGPSRVRQFVVPRQEVMWRARHETPLSLPQIGQRLGGRDHTTVLHGVRQHERRMAEAAA